MRMSKELKLRAKAKQNKRELKALLEENERKWKAKCEKIAKHGGQLAPGGVLYLTREVLYLHSLKEWVAVTAQSLGIPPEFVKVTISTPQVDLTLKELPGMSIAVPEQWFAAKGIAAGSEAQMMIKASMRDTVLKTQESFKQVVRKRYELCGYSVEDVG